MNVFQLTVHIIWRSIIHIFGATGPMLAIAYLLRYLRKRFSISWIPVDTLRLLIFSAIPIFFLQILREPYDVSAGGILLKSWIDIMVMGFSCCINVIALNRLRSIKD